MHTCTHTPTTPYHMTHIVREHSWWCTIDPEPSSTFDPVILSLFSPILAAPLRAPLHTHESTRTLEVDEPRVAKSPATSYVSAALGVCCCCFLLVSLASSSLFASFLHGRRACYTLPPRRQPLWCLVGFPWRVSGNWQRTQPQAQSDRIIVIGFTSHSHLCT